MTWVGQTSERDGTLYSWTMLVFCFRTGKDGNPPISLQYIELKVLIITVLSLKFLGSGHRDNDEVIASVPQGSQLPAALLCLIGPALPQELDRAQLTGARK